MRLAINVPPQTRRLAVRIWDRFGDLVAIPLDETNPAPGSALDRLGAKNLRWRTHRLWLLHRAGNRGWKVGKPIGAPLIAASGEQA